MISSLDGNSLERRTIMETLLFVLEIAKSVVPVITIIEKTYKFCKWIIGKFAEKK